MTDENPFAGLRPAPPPGDLRGRVLAAVRAQRERSDPRDWIDRAWECRPVRIAWSLALLGALVGHLVVGRAARITAAQYGFVETFDAAEAMRSARRVSAELP